MFVKDKKSGDLIEVLDTQALFDPNQALVKGCFHAGEEMPDPAEFAKETLIFPSGEAMPRCWMDPHYKD